MKATKDPKVKLTLSVRKSIAERAREYAGKHHTSVSFLVEEYLDGFREPESDGRRKAEIINSMFGLLKDSPMANMTDKEIKDMMMKDKYGL
ncbi:DUF6364 family protein [Dyadobacter fermentans]|uniref:DUF6364 family protein n=1 Tax=Dyadobacter fermentans TaxID=94254 RepID=UPI001CBCE3B2|nr:DUF6364 family protein [Dyadobacter fermentans]MBZ1362251.1 hypothetical protein [Dyadobacter fermentans]